jgi:hypothetical protein
MTLGWVDARDWVLGLEKLSLDFTRRVYSDLGVGVSLEESLRGMIRDTLLGRLALEPFAIRGPEGYLTAYVVHIEPFLSLLERALGPRDRRRLEHWIKFIACTDQHNPWMIYKDALSVWASTLARDGTDQIGLSVHSVDIAKRFEQVWNIDQAEGALTRARHLPLSEWDLEIFKKRGLLEIPPDSEFFPFIDDLTLAIGMKRFQEFWMWLLSFLNDSEFRRANVFIRNYAETRKRPSCPPEQLPLPEHDAE